MFMAMLTTARPTSTTPNAKTPTLWSGTTSPRPEIVRFVYLIEFLQIVTFISRQITAVFLRFNNRPLRIIPESNNGNYYRRKLRLQ